MSTPTLEQYRSGNSRWNRTHRGVPIELSHHGVSEYRPQGTWCYYLYLHEVMFQRAEDFAKFDVSYVTHEFNGKARRHFPYDDVPDLDWHGGVTFGERLEGFDSLTGKPYAIIKLGCDYGHSWDEDAGYWQGLEDVLRDAIASAEILLSIAPMKVRCAYSGRVDMPDRFYTAINGALVHCDVAIPADWPTWLPADPASLNPTGAA